MRVLFTTWAWPSHYYPMVPIAWALRSAGHDVRMTSQPELLPTMRASGLPSTVVGRDLDIADTYRLAHEAVTRDAEGPARTRADRGDRISDVIATYATTPSARVSVQILRDLEDEARSMFSEICVNRDLTTPWRMSLYGEMAHAMVDDLLALARSWRPDLVVYDPLTFAGPVVAELLGVPAVRSLFGPDVTYFLKVAGLTDVLDRLGLDDLTLLGAATIDPCPPGLQFPDDEHPIHRVRTRYTPYNGVAEVPAWLPDTPKRTRLCLTWGTSIHRLFGEQAFLPGDVILGAAKLAEERDAELVLAITANQRRLLPELPPNVRVLESVPLDFLLPTCDALIHQGGAGTMLTALRHGLPQLVLTQLSDQAANACQLVAAGAGETRAATTLSASDLIDVATAVLDDPAYRAGARVLQRQIREQPAPHEVVAQLSALV